MAILAGRQLSSRAACTPARVPSAQWHPGPPRRLACQARRLRPAARGTPQHVRSAERCGQIDPGCPRWLPRLAPRQPQPAACGDTSAARCRPSALPRRSASWTRCGVPRAAAVGPRAMQVAAVRRAPVGGERKAPAALLRSRQPASCAPAGFAGGRSAARGDGRGVEVPRSAFRTQGTSSAGVQARAERDRSTRCRPGGLLSCQPRGCRNMQTHSCDRR
jgi:hypothetical protein